jgi:hypothetical protein
VRVLRRGRKTFEQRRRWELVRTELWRGRRNIAAAAAWMLGAAVVVLVLPVGSAVVRGFVAGTLVTSWAWMVFVTSLIRTHPVTMGEWGESFTREVLQSRHFGWPFLDDVPMEKRRIDHVAVSPRAVLSRDQVRGCGSAVGDGPLSRGGDGWCPLECQVRAIDPSLPRCQGRTRRGGADDLGTWRGTA